MGRTQDLASDDPGAAAGRDDRLDEDAKTTAARAAARATPSSAPRQPYTTRLCGPCATALYATPFNTTSTLATQAAPRRRVGRKRTKAPPRTTTLVGPSQDCTRHDATRDGSGVRAHASNAGSDGIPWTASLGRPADPRVLPQQDGVHRRDKQRRIYVTAPQRPRHAEPSPDKSKAAARGPWVRSALELVPHLGLPAYREQRGQRMPTRAKLLQGRSSGYLSSATGPSRSRTSATRRGDESGKKTKESTRKVSPAL